MPSSPPVLSSDPTTPPRKSWFTFPRIILGLVILSVVKSLVTPDAPKRPTIEDWITKASEVAPAGYLRAGHLYVELGALTTAVGEPDDIRSLTPNVYMIWECRDGRVQAVVDQHTLSFGQYLIGTVNYRRD